MKTYRPAYRAIRAVLAICMVFTLAPIPAFANTMSPQAPLPVGLGPKGIAVGDVNNDGKNDIVTANYRGRSFTVLFGNGDGTFTSFEQTMTPPSSPASVRIEDAQRGDFGQKEIIVGDSLRHLLRFYHWNGSNFTEYYTLPAFAKHIPTGLGPEAPLFDFDSGSVDYDNNLGLLVPVYRWEDPMYTDGGFMLYRRMDLGAPSSISFSQVSLTANGLVAAMSNGAGFATLEQDSPSWRVTTDGKSVMRSIAGASDSSVIYGISDTGDLYFSPNNGVSWSIANSTGTLRDISRYGSAGFACGASGEIRAIEVDSLGTLLQNSPYATAPGSDEASAALASVQAISPTKALSVGEKGAVVFGNQGLKYSLRATTTDDYHDVAVDPSGTRAIVLGSAGTYVMPSVSQASVVTTVPATPDVYNAVSFLTTMTAVAVGDNGAISRTTDGGQNWTPSAATGTSDDLHAVTFTSTTKGYAVGEGGAIVKTTDGGVTWAKESIFSDAWQLALDYPPTPSDQKVGNPFTAAIGDVNGDGYPDLSVAGYGSGQFLPWWYGAPTFPASSSFNGQLSDATMVKDIRDLLIGDLNGDTLDDVAVAGYGVGKVAVTYQNSIGGISSAGPATIFASGNTSDPAPTALALSDFNSDGLNDLAVVNSYNVGTSPSLRSVGSIGFFRQMPDNSLKNIGEVDVGRQPAGIAIGDLDSDGVSETVVTNNVDNTLQVLKYGAPLPPQILSTSHPDENKFYSSPLFASTFVAPADFDGIEGYYYVVDHSPSTVPTLGSDFSTNGSPLVNLSSLAIERGEASVVGTWYAHVLSLDKKGNLGVKAAHRQILVDNVAPTQPTPDDGIAGYNASPRRTFNWDPSSDALSGFDSYLVSLDNQPEVEQSATKYTADGLSDGIHTFRVRARDKAGNFSAYGIDMVYVDAEAPSIEVTGLPALVAPDTTFTVMAHDAAEVRRVEMYVDGGLLSTDPSISTSVTVTHKFDLSSYASGVHTFTATAYDTLNHATTATQAFTLGTPAPIITSITHPDEALYYNTPFFSALMSAPSDFKDIDGYYYVIDRSPLTVPTIGDEFSSLGLVSANLNALSFQLGEPSSDGTWWIHAVSRDTKGRVGTTAAHRRIRLDMTLPTTPVPDDAVATYTATPARTFNWPVCTDALSGFDTYLVSVDGALETPQTTTKYTATGLSDGTHTFTVRARDKAGNLSGYGSHNAYIDVEPPSITATVPVVASSNSSFSVNAKDKAEVRRVEMYVDNTLLSSDAVSSKNVDVSHKFDLSTYLNGTHTFKAVAYDTLDHPAITTQDFSLEPPALIITSSSHPDEINYYSSPWLNASMTTPPDFGGVDGYYYVVDHSPSTIPTDGAEYSNDGQIGVKLPTLAIQAGEASADGTWYLHAVPRDTNGRIGTNATHRKVLCDLTPATTPDPDDGVATYTASPARTFTWAASTDALSGFRTYRVAIDGAAETTQTALKYTADGLTDGTHIFTVRSLDKAGNFSPYGTHTVYVDSEPPSITINPLPTPISASTVFSVTAVDKAEVRRVEMYVDGNLKASDDVARKSTTIGHTLDMTGVTYGTHTFTAIAYDTLEHTSTASASIRLDAPALTILSSSHPDSTKFYNATTVDANMIIPPDYGGVDGYFYVVDRSPSTVPTSGSEYTTDGNIAVNVKALAFERGESSPDGSWWVHAITRDTLGRVGSLASHKEVRVDATAPSAPVADDGVAGYTAIPARTFTWGASTDALSGFDVYRVSIDSGAETTLTATRYTADNLSDGTHVFKVRAKDKAGNFSAYGTHTAYVDAEPPSVEITSLPALVSPSTLFTVIARDAAEVRRVEYYVDSNFLAQQTFASKVANSQLKLDLSAFSNGTHTFSTIAYDSLDHTATASQSFTLNPPAPTITSATHPSESTYYGSPLFSATIVPPASYDGIGGYYYVVDRAPGTMPSPASLYSASGAVTVNLDALAFERGEASADGTWYIHAISRDVAGRVGSVATHRRVLIDMTPPTSGGGGGGGGVVLPAPTPDDGISGYTEVPRRTFNWSPSSDALSGLESYYVSVDGGPESVTTATRYTADALTDGAHVFRVRVRDTAGNFSAYGSHTAYIDVEAPAVSLLAVPQIASPDSSFTVSAQDTAGVTHVEYYVDGVKRAEQTFSGSNVRMDRKLDLTSLANGAHTFTATAYDEFGHQTSASSSFTLDPPPPSVVSVTHPTETSYYDAPLFGGNLIAPAGYSGVEGYYYTVDRNASTVPTIGADYSADTNLLVSLPALAFELGLTKPDGTWYLHAVSRDYTGRIGTTALHRKIMLDTVAPTVPAPDDGVSGYTEVANRTFRWAASTDSLSGIRCYRVSLDGGVETTQTATKYTTDALSDGMHVFRVRARDKAGNFSAYATHNAYVDIDPPDVTLVTVPSTAPRYATFSASAADGAGISKIAMYVDDILLGSSTLSGKTAKSTRKLDLGRYGNGTHTFTAVAYDLLGHRTEASRSFKLDKSAPSVTSVAPSASPFYPRLKDGYKDTFTVRFTTSEAGTATLTLKTSSGSTIKTIKKKIAVGRTSITWDGQPASGEMAAASYRWYLKVADKVGNTSASKSGSVSIAFYEVVKTGANSVRIIQR